VIDLSLFRGEVFQMFYCYNIIKRNTTEGTGRPFEAADHLVFKNSVRTAKMY
jgi:hypothetical protein